MRYTGPKCKLCRREGVQLFLKGDRCKTQKCSALKKNYPPGMHGKLFGKKSEYGKQLREKQKLKRIYGITEKVIETYYSYANKMSGNTGENLLRLLTLRFDNIVSLAGLTKSRNAARQTITHGYFSINKKKTRTPSIMVKKGDILNITKGKDNDMLFGHIGKQKNRLPRWLKYDNQAGSLEIIDIPEEKELDKNIDMQLIIGFYSR